MKLIYGYKNFIIFTLFNLFYLFSLNFINKNNNYNFLIWNLFLGFVPYLLAIVLHYYSNRINNITLLFGSFLWLVFYPNAPYMITDLIHVNENSSNVIYEALMIFSFSMESLFFGFWIFTTSYSELRLSYSRHFLLLLVPTIRYLLQSSVYFVEMPHS